MNINEIRLPYLGAGIPYNIIPIEAHWSRRTRSNGFCKDTWKRLIKRIKDDPNARAVFVGDMLDGDRPSTRERRLMMGQGRAEVLNEDDLDHMDMLDNHFIPELKPIADKIIGMVDGDHFRVYENRKTSTQYIAEKLGIPHAYLGERMGWIRLTIVRKDTSMHFTIFVRHGKGSSTTFGTDVNALVRQSCGFDADLYLAGHTHRQWFVKVPYLYPGRSEIKQRFVGYARAGSLLRGFLYGTPTYPEIAEYNPLSIGWPEIQLFFTRKGKSEELGLADMKGLT